MSARPCIPPPACPLALAVSAAAHPEPMPMPEIPLQPRRTGIAARADIEHAPARLTRTTHKAAKRKDRP